MMGEQRRWYRLHIAKSWNGEVAHPSEKVVLSVFITTKKLELQVEAPFHNDPAPGIAKGECESLWNYEVVELFLLGTSGHYLEIELGPHGHYLIYRLSGIRQVAGRLTPLHCKTEISDHSWRGSITIDLKNLDIAPWRRANAYAMHGQDRGRRHLAAFPVPGETPDFHQPHYFRSMDDLAQHPFPHNKL